MSFINWKFRKVNICQRPNDLRIGCKSSFNLMEFLERDVDLEEELEEFEGEFEKEEVVEE